MTKLIEAIMQIEYWDSESKKTAKNR